MPVIPALRPTRRRAGYLDLEVDGTLVGPIAERAVEARGLAVGQPIDEETTRALEILTRLTQALSLANSYLAHRPRTAAEVRQRLHQGGHEDEIVDQVIEQLTAQGLLNDQRFAELWVENRATFSPRSSRALEMELRRKGVARESIDAVLASTADDEGEMARDAGRQRLRAFSRLDEDAFRQRMSGYLARRGFGYDVIRKALDPLWAEACEGR